MNGAWLTVALFASAVAPAHAINKCTGKDGKVVYQDAPCEIGTRDERIRVFAGEGASPIDPPPADRVGTPVPLAPRAPAATTSPTAAVGMGPAATDASDLDRLASQCLDWYRPLLRDPAGAYYGAPSFVSGTLTMTLYGRNGFGGYVTKKAACEFKAGRLDHDWTKIQAKRAGW